MGLRGLAKKVKPGRKAAIGGTAAAGAGGLYYASQGDEEAQLENLPPAAPLADAGTASAETRTSRTVQTTERPARTPLQMKAEKLPPLPLLQDMEVETKEQYDKRMEQLIKTASRTPEQKQLFKDEKQRLRKAQEELQEKYASLREQTTTEGERKANIAKWAGLAEGLMNAAVMIHAAQQGLATGRNYVGGVQFTKTDYQKQIQDYLDRAAQERKELFAEERAYTGDLEKEIGTLERGEEAATAAEARKLERLEDRELRARELQGKEARDIQQENIRAQQRRQEREAELAQEAQKFNLREQAEAAGSKTVTTQETTAEKEGTGPTSRRAQEAQTKAYAELEGALARLQKDTSDKIALDEVRKQATLVGIPPEAQDQLISEATGSGAFNLAEPEKVRKILDRYKPGRAQPTAPTPAGATPLPSAPPVGTVQGGYRFKGGNPADSTNWEKVQ